MKCNDVLALGVIARELARHLEIPVSLVAFESAGKMFEAVKNDAWDVAFLAIDPARADQIDFTPPYLEIEGTYLVPESSQLASIDEVDRSGVRIGVSANSAYDLYLRRAIARAELVRAPNPDAAFQLLIEDKVDVVAGVRQHLVANSSKLPGSRVLHGRFMGWLRGSKRSSSLGGPCRRSDANCYFPKRLSASWR